MSQQLELPLAPDYGVETACGMCGETFRAEDLYTCATCGGPVCDHCAIMSETDTVPITQCVGCVADEIDEEDL